MVYFLDKTSYKSFEVFARNKAEARSYFAPFSSRAAAEGISVPLARFQSDRITMLSGEWDFRYYKKISDLPDKVETDGIAFDKVAVPSDWQRTGYEPPVYINQRYQFKLDPPNFPEDCPCGVYRRFFRISDITANYMITFLGAASGFDVYLNGQHIGYSEGSHNTAEFDLSKFAKRGENELFVVVYKFTNGSYLECQDMFRENGIFRDVYLTKLGSSYVFDYEIKTTKIQGKYDLKLTLSGKFAADAVLEVCVSDVNGEVLGKKTAQAESKTFLTIDGLAAEEWSAEIPNIYYLEITLVREGEEVEFIRDIIGFKTVEIDGEVFKFNDKAIKILGVNHHDTDPVGGYVMTPAQMLGDVRLMKEFNINAVRTSHYPPDPIFLLYCDVYGLYVIDEADIETHGCYAEIYKPDLISHDKAWEGHYIDRIKRMYLRDKNRVSVAMWSLGNEAGGHNNQDTAYAYLKEVCPEIPVHYEAASRTPRFRYDVTSEMYPSIDRIRKIAEKKAPKKYLGAPYFICEYCHAMGVGPGGLKEMTDLFFSADAYLGGCIWEFCDHAVYHKDGKYKYTYGGDHGEEFHDGNFCVDGLVYPDRKPHTGLYNVKVNYSPFKTTKVGVGTFEFFNRNFFRNSDYAEISYFVETDGVKTAEGTVDISVPPNERVRFAVDCGESSAKANTDFLPKKRRKGKRAPEVFERDVYITFEYTDKKTGEVVAREQIAVAEKLPAAKKSGGGRVETIEGNEEFVVKFDGGFASIGKKSGNLERLNYCSNGEKENEINAEINVENAEKKDEINVENVEKNAEKTDKKDEIKAENIEKTAESADKNAEINVENSEKRGECACGCGASDGSCSRLDDGIFSERPWDGLKGIYDCIFRAPIDNDRNVAPQMIKFGYDSLKPYVKSIKNASTAAGGAQIEVEKYLLNAKGQALFRVRTVYSVAGDGSVGINVKLKKKILKKLPIFSRVGVNFELCGRLGNVEYFGRGERENLPDFNEHAPVGIYRFKAADAHEPYIKPQDNNRRTEVVWAEFTDGGGRGIRIEADGGRFSFAAHDYTDRALAAAAHDEEIERSGTTFVSLDGYTMGAGSNSCGPLPEEKFLLRANREYEYGFVITKI